MKKIISLFILISLCAFLTSYGIDCGDTKIINGIEYDTYGLINQDNKKNPNIQYEPIWGNIILGCVLMGTIIGPIYFFGFSMFEPVGPMPLPGERIKGEIYK